MRKYQFERLEQQHFNHPEQIFEDEISNNCCFRNSVNGFTI